jgi:gluconokinase
MPATLVDSQFATLEEPGPGEALVLDATLPLDTLVRQVILHVMSSAPC